MTKGASWIEMAVCKYLLSSSHVNGSPKAVDWIYGVGEAVNLWVKPFLDLPKEEQEERKNNALYGYYYGVYTSDYQDIGCDGDSTKVRMRNQIVLNLVTCKILFDLFEKSRILTVQYYQSLHKTSFA